MSNQENKNKPDSVHEAPDVLKQLSEEDEKHITGGSSDRIEICPGGYIWNGHHCVLETDPNGFGG